MPRWIVWIIFRCCFQHGEGLAGFFLHKQNTALNQQRLAVAWVLRQDFFAQLPGRIKLLVSEEQLDVTLLYMEVIRALLAARGEFCQSLLPSPPSKVNIPPNHLTTGIIPTPRPLFP